MLGEIFLLFNELATADKLYGSEARLYIRRKPVSNQRSTIGEIC
jgi:hypothetical protein